MKHNALVIMAKEPHPASVKTRLKESLTDEKRLALYVRLLETTIEKLRSVPGVDTFIAYTPETALSFFKKFKLGLFPQTEGTLGAKLYNAARKVLDEGYRKAVLVGTDIPDISGSIVLNAFGLLSEHEIVFGPAVDGGYYLVGLKRPIRELFEDIPWSSDRTLRESIDRAKKYGFSFATTETLLDIDTIDDVKRAGFML